MRRIGATGTCLLAYRYMVNPSSTRLPAHESRNGTRAVASVLHVAATVLSLGTNKLVGRATGWLQRNGLMRYVLPALLLNEAFGAYRVYLAVSLSGGW